MARRAYMYLMDEPCTVYISEFEQLLMKEVTLLHLHIFLFLVPECIIVQSHVTGVQSRCRLRRESELAA